MSLCQPTSEDIKQHKSRRQTELKGDTGNRFCFVSFSGTGTSSGGRCSRSPTLVWLPSRWALDWASSSSASRTAARCPRWVTGLLVNTSRGPLQGGSGVQPPQGPLQGVQGGSLGHLPIRLENRCKVSKVGHWVTCPSVSRTAAFNPGWVTGSLVLPCQGPLLSIQGGSLGHLSICVKDRCFQSRVGHWVTCPSVSRTTVRWPR